MQSRILIVDDYIDHAENLKALLIANQYKCETVYSAEEALKKMKNSRFDLILLDNKLPGMDGLDFVRALRLDQNDTPIIMYSAFGNSHMGHEAAKMGVYDFLPKGDDLNALYDTIESTIQKHHILSSQKFDAQYFQQKYNFVGISPQIKALFEKIEKIANTDARILIHGETGVGKNLLAEVIHQISNRSDRPFLWLDCTTLPQNLIEAELFGYERGAFTGAVNKKIGRLALADGGTLFIDQIDDLDPALQAKFLRFIETGNFEALGSNRTQEIDIRIIAASISDLHEKIQNKEFRQDLFYRIAVNELFIPPLRRRKEDIIFMARHFIRQNCLKHDKPVFDLTPNAVDRLLQHDWRGNVRELQFFIERLILFKDEGPILEDDIDLLREDKNVHVVVGERRTLKEAKNEFERLYITRILMETDNKINKAAEILGIDRSNLYKKMQHYKIKL